MKRFLAFLLAALTLISFAACGETEEVPDDTSETDNSIAVTNDQNTPDLPAADTLGDLSGDFHILVSGNWTWNDFAADETDTTVVETAIYRRNQYIKQKYDADITTKDIVKYSSAMGSGDGFKALYNDYIAGQSTYDAAMVGTYDVATLAYNGLLWDLNSIPYINLSKDYWDQKANEDLSMNGAMYYTTGDISVADNRATYVMFFSKSMVEEYGLDNPYDLVNENKWTFEKFSSMVKGVGADENQDGAFDERDSYGLITPTDTHLAILSAAQERIATINDKGGIELTFYSERVDNLYSRYLDLIKSSTVLNYQNVDAVTADDRISMFNNNQVLFYSHTLFYMDNLRDIENDFGIIPYPKFDETQESYGNLVSAWHSQFFCIPITSANIKRSGVIIEELAYKGKELLTPAYYDKTLNGQYVRDSESSAMLDIIFDNLVYDVGIYYNIGTYKEQLTSIYRTGNSLVNIYETYRPQAENQVATLNQYFSMNTAQ
ncbi:MAG: extracellular solute-binding protein [Clostridia bacterium]|nr:extracellular solute-binding protein [Clostridia bacterium]